MKDRLDQILETEVWKTYGAVSTPGPIVELMIRLSGVKQWKGLEILEPGCGFCDFLERIYENHQDNNFTGVEVNPQIYRIAKSRHSQFNLFRADFLLWKPKTRYDVVIGNPPYGIIGDKSHYPIHALKEKKARYRKLSLTWFGKYNIYGAFIEKGVDLLKSHGRLIFIVPATFMILDDFKILRKFLSASGRTKVLYLGPKVFQGKTVSTCILVVDKAARGLQLYAVHNLKNIDKCYEKKSYDGEMMRFETPETRALEENSVPLGEVFSIHFAARSPQVKKHSLVRKSPRDGLVPILTGRNLHPGRIDYDHCYSGYWMPKDAASSLREFYGIPHLVVGHTKGGRVVAAIDDKCYPWREEMHLVPKIKGIDLAAATEYLNSDQVQGYMHTLYRDITPHLTATQLGLLPLTSRLAEG